jgi:hypothetical protein
VPQESIFSEQSAAGVHSSRARKVLIPDVIECKSNLIELPELIAHRIGRYANLVGRENVIAGRLRLRHLGWPGRGRPGRGVGQVRRHGRGRAHRDEAILEVGIDRIILERCLPRRWP